MKIIRRIVAAGLVAGVAISTADGQVAPVPSTGTSRSASWHSSFEEALQEAQRLNRPVLVHFYSEWCTPCRRMDREVLRQADVQSRLGRRFVVARIDADMHPELVERFNIRGLPSDVVLAPNGEVLESSEGFRERPVFLAGLDRAIVRFDLALADRPAVPTQPVSIEFSAETDRPETTGDAPAADSGFSGNTPGIFGRVIVGLDGYSPVSLWNAREWRKGRPEFAVEHQGVTYYLASSAETAEFEKSPDRFVPQLLGCDPVVLFETDRALPGSTRYGAYYEGHLYLFSRAETRAQFKSKPTRYTQTKHVLHADELDSTVLK